MAFFGETIKTGDWKNEKHVPIIHAPQKIAAGKKVEIKLSLGDEIAHPNTLEHHIEWFKLFFLPENSKFPVEIATFNFSAHGEGDIFTHPFASASLNIKNSGTIYVLSYCNLHGVWQNSTAIEVK